MNLNLKGKEQKQEEHSKKQLHFNVTTNYANAFNKVADKADVFAQAPFISNFPNPSAALKKKKKVTIDEF